MLGGVLQVCVQRRAQESALARMLPLAETAQSSRATVQNFTESFDLWPVDRARTRCLRRQHDYRQPRREKTWVATINQQATTPVKESSLLRAPPPRPVFNPTRTS